MLICTNAKTYSIEQCLLSNQMPGSGAIAANAAAFSIYAICVAALAPTFENVLDTTVATYIYALAVMSV